MFKVEMFEAMRLDRFLKKTLMDLSVGLNVFKEFTVQASFLYFVIFFLDIIDRHTWDELLKYTSRDLFPGCFQFPFLLCAYMSD